MKERIIKPQRLLKALLSDSRGIIHSQKPHCTHTCRWKAKRTGVACISPDSRVSKIHFESSEKHNTVRLRAHIPEMTAFIGELSPETSYIGKQLLSLLQRLAPCRPQVLGGHITWLCCFRGLPVCLRQMKWQAWTQTPRMQECCKKYWSVLSPAWCVNIDLISASGGECSLG